MVQDRAIVTMAEVIHVLSNRTIFNDLGHFLAISHPTDGIDRYLLAQSIKFGSHNTLTVTYSANSSLLLRSVT